MQHLSATQIVTGRVFTRLQQFHELPPERKDQVAELESYLTTIQNDVFDKHHTLQLKSMRGVRYKLLLETVAEWVREQEALTLAPAADDQAVPSAGTDETSATTALGSTTAAPLHALPGDPSGVAATSTAIPVAPTTPLTPAVITEEVSVPSDEAAEDSRTADEATQSAIVAHAKELIDAMVLKGFITPNKEDKSAVATTNEQLEFKDLDLIVPVATAITGLTIPTTTVWDLVDGTVFAATIKRRAGLLAPLTAGKDVYVLANVRAHSVTLFESDVAREPIRIFEAALTSVTHDRTYYDHGVKLWDETDAELFNMASIGERDAFVAALEAVGVTFQEEFPIQDHHAKPANFNTSHTYTVEEVTDAASDAVPLDDVSDKFRAHVPARTEANDKTEGVDRDETAAKTLDTIAKKDKTIAASDSTEEMNDASTPLETPATIAGENYPIDKSEKPPETTPLGKPETPVATDNHDAKPMTQALDNHHEEAPGSSPTRPRTQSVDYGKTPETLNTAPLPTTETVTTTTPTTTTTTTTMPKHDETSSSSPPEASTNASNLFGEGWRGDVSAQKADKVFRFDEPLPTAKTERPPPKSNYFAQWNLLNTNANDPAPSTPAP